MEQCVDRINEELLWKQVKHSASSWRSTYMFGGFAQSVLHHIVIILWTKTAASSLVEHIRAVESSSCPTQTILFGLLMTQ